MKSVHLMIHGLVQGVFFRAHTQKEAARLGLSGWVKNTQDGCVETVAQGDEGSLESFVVWCHKGPPSANVTKVDILWDETSETPHGFHIRY